MAFDCTRRGWREPASDTLLSVFRQMTIMFAAAFFCALCLARTAVREEGSIDAMGSVISVVAYGDTAEQARLAVTHALDEASRLDAMLSNYKPHSEWTNMNSAAADRPVRVSQELFELLQTCLNFSRQSEGTFDISVGPLMRVWGFYKGTGYMANRTELESALQSVGYRNVLLDPRALTVRFAKKGVELDPGGIGKGYAVDRMVETLQRDGIRAAFVSAGGSSIYALGAPPGEDGWPIELNDGGRSSIPAATVCLRDESLSTSGSYEKFFVADGKRWSHIMDPRTGNPATGMLSVSVIAPRTIDSEAWAKPYFILGRVWAERHKERGFRIFMCEDTAGKPCSWIE
jgi:thiamine biosynthesis lipoprotein